MFKCQNSVLFGFLFFCRYLEFIKALFPDFSPISFKTNSFWRILYTFSIRQANAKSIAGGMSSTAWIFCGKCVESYGKLENAGKFNIPWILLFTQLSKISKNILKYQKILIIIFFLITPITCQRNCYNAQKFPLISFHSKYRTNC